MIVIALCAALCDANPWADVERFARTKEDWFRRFLKLENGIPSHDTFGRVFARLDTLGFYDCLQQWVESLQLSMQGRAVHIDGKESETFRAAGLHGRPGTEGANHRETFAESLDNREPVTLVVGCNFCRGLQPDSQRKRSGCGQCVSQVGAVDVEAQHDHQIEPPGETPDGGLE